MKTKFSKLFVTILIVAAVTCCGALGVFAADDAKADTTAATTASETVNTDNDHNSSLSIGLVAAALATGLAGIGGGMAVACRYRSQQRERKDLRQEPDLRRPGRVHRSVRLGHLHHDPVQAGVTPCGSFSSATTPTP